MNQINDIQRAYLKRLGIQIADMAANGVARCITAQGVRYYTAEDLITVATPSVVERFRSWIAGVAA